MTNFQGINEAKTENVDTKLRGKIEKDLESQISLREGMEKYYKKNRKVFTDRDITDEAKAFFESHDVAHVVFGCDTSFFGEGVVKIWTVFGTTLGFWKHISGYNEADAFMLFRMYSWQHVAKNILRLLVTIPSAIVRAKRMNRLWNWTNFESYMDMPINDIRKEFNIKPIKIS